MRVNMAKYKVKDKKAEVEQKIDIFWKEYNNVTMLAIKVTKGTKTTTIIKEPKYLKELRDHLQTVAKFGLRRNII